MNKEYLRHVRTGYEPFDPLQLTAWTEGIVCKDSMRKYTDFYCTGVYEKGLRELLRMKNRELLRQELGTFDIDLSLEELKKKRAEK